MYRKIDTLITLYSLLEQEDEINRRIKDMPDDACKLQLLYRQHLCLKLIEKQTQKIKEMRKFSLLDLKAFLSLSLARP